MRRRLDVAAALVPKPPVLFLDEPTTGLDLQSRNALWEMIRELVADGTTVLLTTQYLEEADRLAERVAVIDGGHVIANDSPKALKAELGSTVVEMEFSDAERAERAATLLPKLPDAHPEREGSTVRISSEDGSRLLMEALRLLDAEDVAPAKLNVREPSLDDVFLALTGHKAEIETESEDAPQDGARSSRGAA
jgi:ABC-type multidrug transport system ATPase subunit